MRIHQLLAGVALAAVISVAHATTLLVGVDPETGESKFYIASGQGKINKNSDTGGAGTTLNPNEGLSSDSAQPPAPDLTNVADIDDLISKTSNEIIEAIVASKAAIDQENQEYIAKLQAGGESADQAAIDRINENLNNLVGNIVKNAISQGKVGEEQINDMVNKINQQLDKKLDLDNTKPPELSEQEKAKQAQVKLLEQERKKKQEAEKLKQEELKKKNEELQAKLKEQLEKQKAEKEKAAEAAKKKAAEEHAKKLADDAAKKAFEAKQKALADEKEKQKQALAAKQEEEARKSAAPTPPQTSPDPQQTAGTEDTQSSTPSDEDSTAVSGSGDTAGQPGNQAAQGGAGGDGGDGGQGGLLFGDGGDGGNAGQAGAGGSGAQAGQGGDGGKGGDGGAGGLLFGDGGDGGNAGQAGAGGSGAPAGQGGVAGAGGDGGAGGAGGQSGLFGRGGDGGAGGQAALGGQPGSGGGQGGAGGDGGAPGAPGIDPKQLDLVGKNKLNQSQQQLAKNIERLQGGLRIQTNTSDAPGAQGDLLGRIQALIDFLRQLKEEETNHMRAAYTPPPGGSSAGNQPGGADGRYDPNAPLDTEWLRQLVNGGTLPPLTPLALADLLREVMTGQPGAGDAPSNEDRDADQAAEDKLLRDFVEQVIAVSAYPYIAAGDVSALPPTESLTGAMTATYNGRLSGAFGDGTTVGASMRLDVAFDDHAFMGDIVFDGGNGKANVTGGWDTGVNSVSGHFYATEPVYGGEATGSLGGKFYGPKGQELGGNWSMGMHSGVREGQSASGHFVTKQ